MMNETIQLVVVLVKNALLISRSQTGASALVQLLRTEGYVQIAFAENSDIAKHFVMNEEFDLICINAPLAGETGVELSGYFAKTTKACVVMIVPQKNADAVSDLLTRQGVLVISNPVNKHLFHHFLQFTQCFKTRMFSVEQENKKLKHMVEDMKIINRAKLLLITCLNMTETQAHRYLEKQAMDLRISKCEVAKQVINTYEN